MLLLALATLWGGKIRFTVPMCFSIAFLFLACATARATTFTVTSAQDNLTVDGANAPATEQAFGQVAAARVTSVQIAGAGHLVAQEAPDALCAAILDFTEHVDNA